MEKNTSWFQFGRHQGLKNSEYPKIVFKHMIHKDNPIIRPHLLEKDIFVYSGRFITLNHDSLQDNSIKQYTEKLYGIMNILQSDSFARYCILTGKDKSGGYVEISAKTIKEYGIPKELEKFII